MCDSYNQLTIYVDWPAALVNLRKARRANGGLFTFMDQILLDTGLQGYACVSMQPLKSIEPVGKERKTRFPHLFGFVPKLNRCSFL